MEVANIVNFGNAAQSRTVQRPKTKINMNIESVWKSKSVLCPVWREHELAGRATNCIWDMQQEDLSAKQIE
jgi:hypothetical protein